jgi:hypothetical protein
VSLAEEHPGKLNTNDDAADGHRADELPRETVCHERDGYARDGETREQPNRAPARGQLPKSRTLTVHNRSVLGSGDFELLVRDAVA